MNSPLQNHIQGLNKEQLSTASNVTAVSAASEMNAFLDSEFPLNNGSHRDVNAYAMYYENLVVYLSNGIVTGLKNPSEFIEVFGRKSAPEGIILQNDQFQTEIEFDPCGRAKSISCQKR